MKETEFQKLIKFVIEIRGSYKVLNRNSKLSEDLGIDGDDAVEFMQKYSEKFNVDVSNFNIQEYFGPEGFELFSFIFSFFRPKKYKIITLGDLEIGVINGELI